MVRIGAQGWLALASVSKMGMGVILEGHRARKLKEIPDSGNVPCSAKCLRFDSGDDVI